MAELSPTITKPVRPEISKPKAVKTEAQITAQVGRITSKLIERADRVSPLKEVKAATKWSHENNMRRGNTVISALKVRGPDIKSIKVSELTPNGEKIVHKSEVGYNVVRNRKGGHEAVYDSALTSTIEPVEGGTVEKHMRRTTEDRSTSESGNSSAQLFVSEYTTPSRGIPQYHHDASELGHEVPKSVRQAAILNSAAALSHIRGALATVEQGQSVISPPADQSQSETVKTEERFRTAA